MSKTDKDKPRHQSIDDVRWLRKGGPHKPTVSRVKLKEELDKDLADALTEFLTDIKGN